MYLKHKTLLILNFLIYKSFANNYDCLNGNKKKGFDEVMYKN